LTSGFNEDRASPEYRFWFGLFLKLRRTFRDEMRAISASMPTLSGFGALVLNAADHFEDECRKSSAGVFR
jgi:hypothetical protein